MKPANSNWGELKHFFERNEFQNRGAVHAHSCVWVTESIEDMIRNNVVRSDLPDPELEPELYNLVIKHQIHTCHSNKCGGYMTNGQTCKKGFPRLYAPYTYYREDELRYVYRCISEKDR